MRKSIVTAMNIEKNTTIERNMLTIKSPGNGIPPSEINNIIGKKVKYNLVRDYVLSLNDIKEI